MSLSFRFGIAVRYCSHASNLNSTRLDNRRDRASSGSSELTNCCFARSTYKFG